MSNEIMTSGATAGTAATIFSPEGLNQLLKFAEVMANGRVAVPAHLAGKPSDCLAVTMQAAQWGMNPFAVAQKTHVVNGNLGYEAQLVNAVISSSSLISGRINYEWKGDWSKCSGKNDKSHNLTVTVFATLKGEDEPRALTVSMAQAGVRNSPLWEQDPKQQLAYLAVKRWARLHAPDVLLGVYTPDELEEMPRTERDITPKAETSDGLNNLINASAPDSTVKTKSSGAKTQDDRSPDDLLRDFTTAASNAKSIDELDKAYKYAGHVLADFYEQLEKATDVYQIRRDEINEIPM